MLKLLNENDYSETDEFTLIKEMNHWVNQIKKFFVDDKKAQKVIADYFYYDDGAHQEDFKELQTTVKILRKLWKKLDAITEDAEEKEYKEKNKKEGYKKPLVKEIMSQNVELALQDFAQEYNGISYDDIVTLGSCWDDIDSSTRERIRKFSSKIRKDCADSGMDAYELSQEDDDFKDMCDKLVDHIRVIVNRCKKGGYNSLREQDTKIEVKHEGILEVPEGKNVDDLPMSHFEKLVKKNGLSKITKALNNLQVWNKNDDKKLSKWAGDMIDKLTKKYGKNESISVNRFDEGWHNGDAIITFTHNDDLEADLEEFLFDIFKDNPDVFDFDWSGRNTHLYLACNKDDYDYIKWFINDWKDKHRDEYDESLKESGMYDYYDTPDGAFDMHNDMPTEEDEWWSFIPSELRAVVHEMEETGWEGVGFTTTGVDYCISKEDKNRPELSYEMCVSIYDGDNSVSLSKYVDIFDLDKEKDVSRIPNTSGVREFRTKEDVRRFAKWFNSLGNMR